MAMVGNGAEAERGASLFPVEPRAPVAGGLLSVFAAGAAGLGSRPELAPVAGDFFGCGVCHWRLRLLRVVVDANGAFV